MPASELHMWAKYFEARPIGWREDNRTAMMLQSQGVKQESKQIFPTLYQLKKWEDQAENETIMKKSLAKSIFGAKLQAAHKKD
jgi:hypothetical protein